VFSVSLTFLSALVVAVFAEVFLAAQVELYRDGLKLGN
jgi:hypothetical protein